jgi:hypothetical protein
MNNATATTAVPTIQSLEAQGVKPMEEYVHLSEAELYDRIQQAKQKLGDRVVILGHHYQRDDVICHADFTGDSFNLAPEGRLHRVCGRAFYGGIGGHPERTSPEGNLAGFGSRLFDGGYGQH